MGISHYKNDYVLRNITPEVMVYSTGFLNCGGQGSTFFLDIAFHNAKTLLPGEIPGSPLRTTP
jgi:hypothetical protein